MTRLDWLLHPALQYGVSGGLMLCLYLFAKLKIEWSKVEKSSQDKMKELSEQVVRLQAQLDQARAETRELQEHFGMLVPPAPAASGLNLSKRGQVLQMHRRGQSADQIAVTLALPRTEVDLLLKIHRLVLEQTG
jgi:hypothetical protein